MQGAFFGFSQIHRCEHERDEQKREPEQASLSLRA
jgi:hypothetical protein